MGFMTRELNDLDVMLTRLVEQAHDEPSLIRAREGLEAFRSLRAEVVRLNAERERARQPGLPIGGGG